MNDPLATQANDRREIVEVDDPDTGMTVTRVERDDPDTGKTYTQRVVTYPYYCKPNGSGRK